MKNKGANRIRRRKPAKNGKSPGCCGNSQPGQNVRKVCEPSYTPIIACITAAFIIELCLLWFFFSSVPVITTYVPYTVQRNDTLWDIAKKFAPEEMDLREYIQILQEENKDSGISKGMPVGSGEHLMLPMIEYRQRGQVLWQKNK